MNPVALRMRALLGALALGFAASAAIAQGDAFPQRPVKIVVPFTAGGSADFLGRLVAERLTALWGKPVIVENRPGASTLLGLGMVAKSAPDGYTLGMNTSGLAPQPALRKTMPFDVLEDVDFVAALVETPFVLTAHPSLGVASARELVAWAKANPGTLNYGSFGVGSTPHILGEILVQAIGTKIVHVPFKGSSESIAAHLAGNVQVNFDVPQQVLPHVRAGKLRALAITSTKRFKDLPEVPTGPEAGMPDLDLPTTYGILAPRRLPPEVLRKLNEGFVQVLRQPEVAAALDKQAMSVVANRPEEFRADFARTVERTRRVVANAGIQPSD